MASLPDHDYPPSEAVWRFEDWLDAAYSDDPEVVCGIHDEARNYGVTRSSCAEYVLWTWEDPQTWLLDRFSIERIGVGLWDAWHVYGDRDLPRELRRRGWLALENLFRRVFMPLVSDSLAHLNESSAATKRLDGTCYMWWDVSPYHHYMEWFDDSDKEGFLALCRECLFCERPAIQESAIHGLGHAVGWDQSFPPATEMLEEFLRKGVAARPELVAYAEEALTGRIL